MSPLLLLILTTTLIRVVMSWALGLGIDETYMVAASRHLELSYYDHPPIAWWLTHAAMALSGSQAPVVVRLPFILLFALSTWLMARITARLFDSERAGFWAAFILNLSPVYAVTGGGWVLPDGPLDCALLGFLLFSLRATGLIPSRRPWADWLAAGACAGLAMLSKYNGLLVLAGLPVFLLTTADGRAWLRRPQPWVAGLLALLLFSPVIVWNIEHHWASFAFQGDRAGGLRFHPLAPLGVWGGEALFVLPWIWVPLILLWLRALRHGPGEPTRLVARSTGRDADPAVRAGLDLVVRPHPLPLVGAGHADAVSAAGDRGRAAPCGRCPPVKTRHHRDVRSVAARACLGRHANAAQLGYRTSRATLP